jgi:hypothetical protein
MTKLIAEAYKAVFSIVAFLAVAFVLIVAAEAARTTGFSPGTLSLAAGGLLIIVLVMGAMALQIQNNQLLKQIAQNTAGNTARSADNGGTGSTRTPAFAPSADGPWPSRREPPVSGQR